MTFFEGSSAFLFPPPCLAATFTMTTHTTTTTTLVASPIIKSKPSPSPTSITPTPAPTPPATAPIFRTPPFFPRVYAGSKRQSVAVSEQPAKRLRQNGAFRPRICRFSGPRTDIFNKERRYSLPPCCAVGKRSFEVEGEEERGLKARVLRSRRLHFVTSDEETLDTEKAVIKKEKVEDVTPTPTPAIVAPRPPIYLRRDASLDKTVFHLDIRKSEPMQPTLEEPESDAETIVPSRINEEPEQKPKASKRAVLTPVQLASTPSPAKLVDDHDDHDDCPADDDEPKKTKEKSVLSKIGSLKSFKDAVAKAGSRVKKWKQRKEKEQEEKKKAAEEKKSKKKEGKDKKQKEVHDSGSDTEEDTPKSKDKSLRNSLRLKSPKKSKTHVRNVFKSTHDDEESDDEVEVKPKRRSIRAGSPPPPSPKSPTDAEMKDSANHADTESDGSGDETEEEKPKKKKPVKADKEDKEDKEEEKPKKKRLSLSSIKIVEKPKEEKKEKAPESSAVSIKDIEMILDEKESENNAETKSIKSSDSSEEMDLDDNKTIRGDDEKDNTGSSEDSESEPKKTSETADAPSKEPASKNDNDDAEETATICGKSDDADQKADSSKSESKGTQEAQQSSDCQGDDSKRADSTSSFSGLKRAVLAVLPPRDVLTPPPSPPLGYTSPKAGDRSHWISWRAGISSTDGNRITEDDRAIWQETWAQATTGKKSLRRRLSAIFKKTLEESDVPSNISRHAYRDSFCRDDDEDTECDANSVYKLPLTTPPLGIDFRAWEPADNGTVDSRFLERLESFTMAC